MFIEMLKDESWDNIINHADVNESFSLFLNTFFIIFESCFPMQYLIKFLITTGLQQESKYLVSAKSIFTL